MNTFSLVQNALNASAKDESKNGLSADELQIGRITAAVQTVVDALTPPDGGRYVVGFANVPTAATSLAERRIVVSSKPLRDASLTEVEKAVVIATFAAHEIGHTLVTRPRKNVVQEHNAHSGYHAVANVADDIILEPVMVDRYPILVDAFDFTAMWVLKTTADELPKVHRVTSESSTPERFNLLLGASRYPDIAEIVFEGERALEERDWSREWAARLIATRLTDHATFIALCDEAWLRIRVREPKDETPPPPPIIVDPEGEPGKGGTDPGEDEGEGGEGESESEPEGEPEGESEDGEGEGGESESESEDGEPRPAKVEPGEGETDGGFGQGDEPRDWDDESEGEGPGGDDDDGDDESEGGEPAEEGEADGEDHPGGVPDEAGVGGGGNAEVDARDENEFDESKVDQTTHDKVERKPYDWDGGDQVERAIRKYAGASTLSFGQHGTMTVEWS